MDNKTADEREFDRMWQGILKSLEDAIRLYRQVELGERMKVARKIGIPIFIVTFMTIRFISLSTLWGMTSLMISACAAMAAVYWYHLQSGQIVHEEEAEAEALVLFEINELDEENKEQDAT